MDRTRRRQVHIWLSDREYNCLRALAENEDETLSATLRRLLKLTTTRPTNESENGATPWTLPVGVRIRADR